MSPIGAQRRGRGEARPVLDVSIVVPTYNRKTSLERLLRGLAVQTYPPERFEVLVIDDGSEDGTPGHLRTLSFPYLLLVVEQAHQGPAAARNLGVAHAKAPLILFLDDDVLPAPDLIAAHISTHTHEGPGTVVIGPMSPPNDWERSAWVRWEEEKLQHQYTMLERGVWKCSVRQFYTANSSLSRALFTAVGGFDVRFTRAEDVELGYRLRRHGARFVFTPGADVLHYASRTFSAWCRTPHSYGRFDVIMSRDKGHEALELALRDFHLRHVLSRALSRATAGRPRALATALTLLSVTVRASTLVGARGVASRALSGTFHLLYWQGVCEELGGREILWRCLESGSIQPTAARVTT